MPAWQAVRAIERSFSTGVIYSYFLVQFLYSRRKVLDLLFCNFRTLVLLVLAQTVEQKDSLPKTEDVITFSKVFGSRRCLILLIWFRLAIQVDVIFVTCSLKLRVASTSTLRSQALMLWWASAVFGLLKLANLTIFEGFRWASGFFGSSDGLVKLQASFS